MRRIGILTAGGDTPALNATLFGAVERANQLGLEVTGIMKGFGGLVDSRVPHLKLNPLFSTIPELDPSLGGTILGASRTYIDDSQTDQLKEVAHRLERLEIEGLICIGGDGTINGMQPLTELFPCVLAPKTIDNDLGLNYLEEPNEWVRDGSDEESPVIRRTDDQRRTLVLEDFVNFATPGYATAVFVVAQAIERVRTTAESHRRIAIVEVMGRQSGYIALGSAYGQPDIILIPEQRLQLDQLCERINTLYDLQKNVVIVLGEGVLDEEGNELGNVRPTRDPAGNVQFSGAAEALRSILCERMGNEYFRSRRRHETAKDAIFTRKVGHTQRGGRPILFDRFHAAQLGGKAVELIHSGRNNMLSTLQWSEKRGFHVDSLGCLKLRDRWGTIHPRSLHPQLYDARRFMPSDFGVEYLDRIFSRAVGAEYLDHMRTELFSRSQLTSRHQSINVDIHKRMQVLPPE